MVANLVWVPLTLFLFRVPPSGGSGEIHDLPRKRGTPNTDNSRVFKVCATDQPTTQMMTLEHFHKYCSHAVRRVEEAVFLGFGFVLAQSQAATGMLLRQSLAKTPKILAPHGYSFSSNALVTWLSLPELVFQLGALVFAKTSSNPAAVKANHRRRLETEERWLAHRAEKSVARVRDTRCFWLPEHHPRPPATRTE